MREVLERGKDSIKGKINQHNECEHREIGRCEMKSNHLKGRQ